MQASAQARHAPLLGGLHCLYSLWCALQTTLLCADASTGLLIFFAYVAEWRSKLTSWLTGSATFTTPKVLFPLTFLRHNTG